MKKIEVEEDRRYIFPRNEVIKHVCCDCKSTHLMYVKPIVETGGFSISFISDNRSTAQRRRWNDTTN